MTDRLAYTVHPGRGPYLALMHGFLSSARQWQQNLKALGEVCTPVTIELWGHGQSPAPNNIASYQPMAYIAQLEQIRQALNAEQWLLCGYSLSAGLTIRYAHHHPQRVIAHLFTNSASGFADPAQISTWQQDAAATAGRILDKGHAAIERIAVHPRFAKRLPPEIRAVLLEDAANLSPRGVAHTMQHTTPNASVRDIAAANSRPALLCFGRLEKRFAAYQQWAAEHMDNLQISALDAGHAVNMEDSAGFNKSACAFIRQHSA